jgi:two-component system response regulator DevR
LTIRIVIVDDHELVRIGVMTLLGTESDLEVVGDVGTGQDGLELCRQVQPDVVVLDQRLPDTSGIDTCRALVRELPATKVLMLSTFTDSEVVLGALRAGASGFLVKDVQSMDLKRNIRAIARGEVVIDPKVAHHLVQQVQLPGQGDASLPLNPRQVSIIRLVAQGYTNREIAQQLFFSEKTVKTYLTEALRRLNVTNRVEAAMLASKRGWI